MAGCDSTECRRGGWHASESRGERARTRVVEGAVGAIRFSRMADGTAMQYQTVRQIGPFFGREAGGDLTFDGHRVRGGARPVGPPPQSPSHTNHMRVHRKTGHAERVAQHHVRGFAAHARQADQRSHIGRHLAPESHAQLMRQPDDIARFRTEEADGADDVLDVLGIRGGKLRRTGIFAEQLRRDHVHALVGGLRAQHRSHQQFERRIEVQRAFRIGNLHAQLLVFLMHARDPRLLRFPRHASQPTPRMRTNAGNLRKRRNRQKQRKSIEKTTENQQKTTGNQRKANENKRNPSNINGMIARKSQLSPDSP